MEYNTHGHNFTVYLSAATSIGSFISAYATQSNIAWIIGLCAGIMAIYSGYMTAKEKKLSIKKLKKDLNEK